MCVIEKHSFMGNLNTQPQSETILIDYALGKSKQWVKT